MIVISTKRSAWRNLFILLALLVFVILWIIVKLIRRGKEFAEEGVDYERTEGFTPERRRPSIASCAPSLIRSSIRICPA